MRTSILVSFTFCCVASLCHGQLTTDQKVADFQQLAAIYAKNYAPYEWKVAVQRFDLFNIAPWMVRVRQSKDDLEFLDICSEYVASLNDAHAFFGTPSDFTATLGFAVDIYDGKVLIDSINRTRLPARDYPFAIGDELISIDARPVENLINSFQRYNIAANPLSTRRLAASLLPARPQILIPRAHEIGDSATIVVRRQSGEQESYTIPWVKTGTPLATSGRVPSPKMTGLHAAFRTRNWSEAEEPSYMEPLQRLQNISLPAERWTVLGFGARTPIFTLPSNFQRRLGGAASDIFYSGTFEAGGFKVGFIRIPNYGQPASGLALQQFEGEIAFMQENTDGLIIDEMRNPGGNACYDEALLARIIPYTFRTLGFEIRATANWIASFSSALVQARASGADQWMIDLLETHLKYVRSAYVENRGRTGALPLCGPTLDLEPARDRTGKMIAYSKPVMVLADEMSASGGDFFPAVFQDNQRGILFGMRTMGAGGSVVPWDATSYSEGFARITVSLMERKNNVITAEYPAAKYVENIGVRPDIEADYMTRENLMTGGRPFVQAFTDAMVEHIRKSKQ